MHSAPWLSTQRTRESVRGVDYYELACDPVKLTDYARDYADSGCRALEHAALLIPTSGLPDDEQRVMWEKIRDNFADHLVETLEAISSLLNAIGCSDEELRRRYGTEPAAPGERADNNGMCTKNPDDSYNQMAQQPIVNVDESSRSRTAEK